MGAQFRLGAAMTAVVILAAGCGAARAATSQPASAGRGGAAAASQPRADPRPYAAGDTEFGLDLLHAWCQQAPAQNIVFSPATLASSLGMAYLGARGATAAAMARVLHLPAGANPAGPNPAGANPAGPNPAAGTNPAAGPDLAGLLARTRALSSLDGPRVRVSASNEIWDAQPSLPAYRAALATAYRAGVGQIPADPAAAARIINATIAASTGGQIRDLLSPDALRDVSWVLTAAMYLKADWAVPFEALRTFPQQFRTAGGRPVQAPFLHGDGVRTGTASGWTSVVLPYRGGKLSMVALLPPPGANAGCAVPPAGSLSRLASAATTGSVALPKVDLRSKTDASGLLQRLGMSIAFSATAANFTGISPNACCVKFVQQAATLRVDEKGTVASAAAATGVMPTSARAPVGPQVVFDRPYLLLITTSGGEPLFLARVANPLSS